jgi:hypothetical protein
MEMLFLLRRLHPRRGASPHGPPQKSRDYLAPGSAGPAAMDGEIGQQLVWGSLCPKNNDAETQ